MRRVVGNRIEFLDDDRPGYDLPRDIPIDALRAEQIIGKSIAEASGSIEYKLAVCWFVAMRCAKETRILAAKYSQMVEWAEGLASLDPIFEETDQPDPT